jgi:hypothetical protein
MLAQMFLVAVIAFTAPQVALESDPPDYLDDLFALIEDLREDVFHLRMRVEELESLLASQDDDSAPGSNPTAFRRGEPVMIFEQARRYEPERERRQIESLEEQIAAKQSEIDDIDERLERARRPGVRVSDELSSTERGALSTRSRRLSREVLLLRGQVARIQRESEVPRYWLMGWNGHQDVMLLTSRDESDLVMSLARGELLQWVGDLVDLGVASHWTEEFDDRSVPRYVQRESPYRIYVVRRVWKVNASAPAMPPTDRVPVWTPHPDQIRRPSIDQPVFPRLPDQ